MGSIEGIKVLAFDVFGTCVDWRSSVTQELADKANGKVTSATFQSTAEEPKGRVLAMTEKDWARFAQSWRDSYKSFCKTFRPRVMQWKSIDQHHHDSLVELLNQWELSGLYSEDEIKDLSQAWHRLRPWDDTAEGIQRLGTRFRTATLSNGNRGLLEDLNAYGHLRFQTILSAADFRAYKPNPEVYLGAAAAVACQPQEVALVAAHLGDLEAARSCGLKTVYVERPGEEEWLPGEERFEKAREWVDIWISETEGGFVELANRLVGPATISSV